MKKLSSVLSYILHPVFIPVLFMLFILSAPYYFNSFLKPEAFRILLLTVFIFTLFIPIFILTISRMLGVIDSFLMERRSERIFALLITAVSAYFAFRMLAGFELPAFYTMFFMGMIPIVLLTALISLFFKISIHMVGWGSFAALMVLYILNYQLQMLAFVPIVFLLSGIVAWSRLEQKAHAPIEVYSGFGLGLLAAFSWFL
ncbi:MAG: hypothetical protein JXR53_03320 [Bacteroidales bacterium]|nr:hypothetical protein [Bacteroidales bacterium]